MRLSLLLALSLSVLSACGDDAPPEPELDTSVLVGPLELAISARSEGGDPSNALHIDVNQSLVRMEGVHVIELERGGRLPASALSGDTLADLTNRIRSAPSRSTVALRVHGAVPYGTTVRVVRAALEAGYRNVSFAVRPPNAPSPTSSGWMNLTGPRVVGVGDDVTFTPTRAWSDFADNWQEVYEQCRAGSYVDCGGRPAVIAEGGELEMSLFTRGNGMVIRFFQVNAPDAGPASTGPAMLEGLRAPTTGEETVPVPPATEGAFSFRFQEASAAENHISLAMRPVCGAAACPLIVEADEETETMRILSLVGAVAPVGAAAPSVVFRMPNPPPVL
jgi:hypothetical protein